MAYERQIGGEGTLFVGEDKTLRFRCFTRASGVCQDMTGWDLLFDIRLKDNSPDPAIVSKPHLALTGIFDPNPSLNMQRAIVLMTDDDMNLFRAKVYRWSVKRMDSSVETVLGYGDFAPQKATAP